MCGRITEDSVRRRGLKWKTLLPPIRHTTKVRYVTKADCGSGVTRDRDFHDIDGMITDEPGVVLATFYADCVPLYFVDPVHRAIGLSHSGWRGTVHKMGQATLDAMHERFGTEAKDVIAAVVPSICQDCYEVSGDVIEEFRAAFRKHCMRNCSTENQMENTS